MLYSFSGFNNIIALGDIRNLNMVSLKERLSKYINTVIIYTGDFPLNGKYINDLDMLENIEYTIASNNNILLLIRGNHDNPEYFKAKSQFKKDLSEISSHIVLVPDYQIVSITLLNGDIYNILCVGGGYTLDRSIHSADIEDCAVKKIKLNPDKFKNINAVVSHVAPLIVYPMELTKNMKHFDSPLINAYSMYDKHIKTDIYKSRHILKVLYDFLISNNNIDCWIYGHYCKSNKMIYENTNFISLGLNEIQKIK